MNFTNIADLVNPETGNTYRQDNSARSHKIPLGSLVEIVSASNECDIGLRLFVVDYGRDCDQTPLYTLSASSLEDYRKAVVAVEKARQDRDPQYNLVPLYKGIELGMTRNGWSEEGLKVIRPYIPR